MSQKNSPKHRNSLNPTPERSRADLAVPGSGSAGPRLSTAPAARPGAGSSGQTGGQHPGRGRSASAGNLNALGGLLGSVREDTLRGMAVVKSKIKGFFRRASIHLLAFIGAGAAATRMAATAPFISQGEIIFLFYLGAISLFPRRFNLRQNSFLFPFVTSLCQLALTLAIGLDLPLALFLAGAQTWLQRAVIRHFRIGFDWLGGIILASIFAFSAVDYEIPYGLLLLTAACGLGAYYAAQHLDARKQGRLHEAALAAEESRNPFAHFHASLAELSRKGEALPNFLRTQVQAITAQGSNILTCMENDPADVQPGTRFLTRYLPPSHKLVDDYLRLSHEGQGHQAIEKVLGRVDELLERLAHAFREEHGSLLRNDAMQLSAELQVLDKLLKMEGK